MKINKILTIFLIATLFSCSGGDDDPVIIVGGPSDDAEIPEDEGNTNAGSDADPFTYSATKNLKNVANFPMGNIVSASKLSSSSTDNTKMKNTLKAEFTSITAENDMKMAEIFRGENNYNFSKGDEIVSFAKANGIRVHGHALVWHQSIPGWLNSFSGTDAEFETLIENYVKATVTHFAEEKDGNGNSVVESWDVLNEAWDGGSLRSSIFRTRMGNDYISKLFTWAREADANVKLFYNDYNIAGESGKRNAIISMVTNFQANGIPIDGIGMQMHLNHNWPTTDLPNSIQDIANTGLLVHISELDVKVNYGNDISELTEARAKEQEDQYQRVGYYYTQYVPQAQQFGCTLWGFRDKDSWLYNNGSDWPLLYDNDFVTKISHRGLIAGLNGTEVN